jgi:hypothetical protein
VFARCLKKNARMKTKLTTLIATGLFIAAGLCIADVATSSSAPPPINPAATIRLNLLQMLQGKAPIKPLIDIPGGAQSANNRDAAYFAWQEFIALNWANVPVTGTANTVGAAGARETADTSKKFGQSPVGVKGTSYPALVWESTRHRSEIFTPPAASSSPSPTPNGYTNNAAASWGYNSTPGYVYPGLTITGSSQSGMTPFVNLDEGSQIGTCQMFWKGSEVLFMAKANYMEYGYVASRGWYDSELLANPPSAPGPVASFANTSGYIVTQGDFPPAGNVDGSQNAGSYVSLPNGTLEFKAAFRIATDAERQAYENGQPIPGGYHAAPIRYYRQLDSSGTNYAYVDTVGVLLSLHIIQKTPSAPYFIFATFEHKDDIQGTDGNPVEDADGNRNPNAFTTAKPTPPPPSYVYPSSGTTPPGKYLVDATTPNVLEFPSQFQSGNVTGQQFIPPPSGAGIVKSTTQSSYQNTRNPTPSKATLPAANSPSVAESYITVNRRRFSIPSNPIIAVNQDVHNLIKMYGYAGGTSGIATSNVWLNYKLVNVQWVPAGNASQKTPGQLYGYRGTSAVAKTLPIPVESFYLSNSLVETNMILSAFSGRFNNVGDGLSITDFYHENQTYTDSNTGKLVTKNTGAPFYNVYTKGGPYNMGGCMGCHGNTAVNGGSDASFILGNGSPFDIEGIDPPAETMLKRFQGYFRRK